MIHRRHAERVARLIDEAVQSGSQIACGGASDADARYVAPTLLRERARGCANSQGGDLWPGTADPDLRFPRHSHRGNQCGAEAPGLYAWTRSERTVEALQTNTSSGSLCVNLCLQQFAQHNLPFGGVNTSGIGNAHGFFGFKAFSHERAVMSAGPLSALKLLFPPYDARKRRLSELLIKYVT